MDMQKLARLWDSGVDVNMELAWTMACGSPALGTFCGLLAKRAVRRYGDESSVYVGFNSVMASGFAGEYGDYFAHSISLDGLTHHQFHMWLEYELGWFSYLGADPCGQPVMDHDGVRYEWRDHRSHPGLTGAAASCGEGYVDSENHYPTDSPGWWRPLYWYET